jgi:hypothetical protein
MASLKLSKLVAVRKWMGVPADLLKAGSIGAKFCASWRGARKGNTPITSSLPAASAGVAMAPTGS